MYQPAANADQLRLSTPTVVLLLVVLGLLAIAFVVGQVLKRQPESTVNPAVVQAFNRRILVWWMMCAILVFGFLLGYYATVVLFGLVSFVALREFITVTPTRRADHRTLFWVFFVFTPLQYIILLIGLELDDHYRLFSITIPVYAGLFIPARIAFSGDYRRFLERSAKILIGLSICVYSLSHAPALLALDLQTSDDRYWEGSRLGLLFYFVLVVQMGDVFQSRWSLLRGRTVIAPEPNASRTWEGFFGGLVSTTLLGTLLWWVTPFSFWESAFMSAVLAVMGFAGSMTMSAIKRDRGVKDYGTLVEGHAGVLDRIDSICFAAPVFFHLTRCFFSG